MLCIRDELSLNSGLGRCVLTLLGIFFVLPGLSRVNHLEEREDLMGNIKETQDKCSVPFCYAVPHNLLKSLVLVFFQALGMEIQQYRNVHCALTD
jgi:hypothetical protein